MNHAVNTNYKLGLPVGVQAMICCLQSAIVNSAEFINCSGILHNFCTCYVVSTIRFFYALDMVQSCKFQFLASKHLWVGDSHT